MTREELIEALVIEAMQRTGSRMENRAMLWNIQNKPNWLEKNIKDSKTRDEIFGASISNAEKRLAKLRQPAYDWVPKWPVKY